MKPIPDTTSYQQSPTGQRMLEASRARRLTRLAGRELVVELLLGGSFLVVALALLLLSDREAFSLADAVIVVVVLAVASRVTFEVGSSSTTAVQLALIPALFVVPPETVPACVCVALTLSRLVGVMRNDRPLSRVLLAFGESWFAVGPALVFTIAGAGAPDGHDWLIYVAALLAEFVVDAAAELARETMLGAFSLSNYLAEGVYIWLVDTLLSPAGLAIGFAAAARPWILLLALPPTALMHLFASERRARIDHALELGRAYRGTALVLGNVIEADDEYTGVHCQGVVALAVQVAEDLGLDAIARRNVEFGALLHDVGKIVIPKEIINKPGPLDDEEWDIIRTHTIEGQRLLDQVGGFMREVGAVVRASHEAFDGSGYPDGLCAEQIPLEARIVACCDAYDAMTTDRAYRRARPAADALAELRRCSGSQFDPRVVQAVVSVVTRQDERARDDSSLLPDPSVLLSDPTP